MIESIVFVFFIILIIFVIADIFIKWNIEPKILVKEFGYIHISPKVKDYKEIVKEIKEITIAKSVFFIIKNILFIILTLVILIGGLIHLFTREEKEEIITNQYNLIQTQNNPLINVILSENEYMLTFVMENNNKAVLKKVNLNEYWDKNNIEFIANDNVMPNVQIIEKNFYETNLIYSTFNKDYREDESKEYTYIFTLQNDDVVETLNKINGYKE